MAYRSTNVDGFSSIEGQNEGLRQVEADNVPLGLELASADYSRSGPDLLIETTSGETFLIPDYFGSHSLPTVIGTDGISLPGRTVRTLAGGEPIELAQTAGGVTVAAPGEIGKIVSITGTVTIQRADGTTVSANQGTTVRENDVVTTGQGSEVAITFTDGSVFNLSENARMTLDEYIYDPNGGQANMLVGLLQGAAAVISGEIAPTGNMNVATPAATLGIRGTSAIITLQGGDLRISLITDIRDGQGGFIEIVDNATGQVLQSLSESDIGSVLTILSGSQDSTLSSLTAEEQQIVQSTIQTLVQSFNAAQSNAIVPEGGAGPQDGNDQPDNDNGDTTPDRQGDLNTGPDLAGNGLGSGNGPLSDPNGGLNPPQQPGSGQGNPNDPNIDPIPDDGGPNPEPTDFTVPGSVTVGEDGSTVVSGFNLTGSGTITMSITVTSTIQLASIAGLDFISIDGVPVQDGQVIFDTDEFHSVVFQGTAEQINAALNGLIYRPSADDDDGGQISFVGTNDSGEQIFEVALGIDITPVNDPPEFLPVLDEGFESGLSDWAVLGVATTVTGAATEGAAFARVDTAGSTSNQSSLETHLGLTQGALSAVSNDGNAQTSDNIVEGSAIVQTVNVVPGSTITFDWRFETRDYLPFNDFVAVVLGDTIYELFDVQASGNLSGQFTLTEWATFTIPVAVSGEVELGFLATNVGDGAVETALLVDNIRVNGGGDTTITELADGAPGENTATQMANGQIGFTDPDSGDSHTVTQTLVSALDGNGLAVTPLGTFTVEISDPASDDGVGTVGWTFQVDDALIDFLGSGQSITQTYSIELEDLAGLSTTLPFTVIIQGVDDAPEPGNDIVLTNQGAFDFLDIPVSALLQNDSDPEGGNVVFDSVASPAFVFGETVSFQLPLDPFNPSSSFDYTVTDPTQLLATATVDISRGSSTVANEVRG
ncbi:MAG: FecR domain-containing protein, partial [Pseudomonadota bacterium]